jgi:hypothetical protein
VKSQEPFPKRIRREIPRDRQAATTASNFVPGRRESSIQWLTDTDANLIGTVARTVSGTPTNLLTGVQWASFGPATQYDQENTISGNKLRATLSWNLAYRATQISYAAAGVNKTRVDFTEDAKGRYTQKLYSNVHVGILNDYLQFDWMDKATCDASVSGTCPTSSSSSYSNVSYNTSNDRSSFRHNGPGYGDHLYTVNYQAFPVSDRIDSVVSDTGGTIQVSGIAPSASGESCYSDAIGGIKLWQSGWAKGAHYDACDCGCCLYSCSLRSGGKNSDLHRCYSGEGPCTEEIWIFLLQCARPGCIDTSLCRASARCDVFYYGFPAPPLPGHQGKLPGTDGLGLGTGPSRPGSRPGSVSDVDDMRLGI